MPRTSTDNMTSLDLTTYDSLLSPRLLSSSQPESIEAISPQGRPQCPHYWSHSDPCAFAFGTQGFPLQIPASLSQEQIHRSHRCIDLSSSYPSPPSTSSQSVRSVPLPTFGAAPSSNPIIQAGGVLDSPLVMRDAFLAQIPISPPPTLPTATLALPDTDGEFSSIHAEQCSDGHRVESVASESPDGSFDLDQFVADDAEDSTSCNGDAPPPLSPLSPEWMYTKMNGTHEDSALLSELPAAFRSHKEKEHLLSRYHGDYTCRQYPVADPSLVPSGSVMALPVDTDEATLTSQSGFSAENDGAHNSLFLPSIPQYTSGSLWEPPDDLGLPISPRATPGSLDFYQLTDGRPHLPFLDIPESYDTPAQHVMQTDSEHWNSGPLDSNAMDIDENASSPGPQLFDAETLTPESNPDLYPQHSPRLFRSPPSLPDLDDIELGPAPSSPSRRSVSSLPDFDMENDPFFVSPSSPTQRLLSLPGADTDDDLIPDIPLPDTSLPEPSFTVPYQGNSLLLIDDPNDVPPPRSPSPEHFDLDLSLIDQCDDPDLKKLYELRKKAVAAERAARLMEAQMLEQGAVHMRAEARRVRKMEKERSREIGALLRLKLDHNTKGAEVRPAERSKNPKKIISSLSQLVARMMFRRHETFRPLANRKVASAPRDYVHSYLSRSIGAEFRGENSR